jgi:Uncharacterized conserved protein
MNFSLPTIDESIISRWPATALGCLVYSTSVIKMNFELCGFLKETVIPGMAGTLNTAQISDLPNLKEGRAAYKAFGIDPGRYRISSEALYRRLRQGKELYQINSLVDTNNLVSIETGFSLGSYDLVNIGPDVVFRLGKAGEAYQGIGKDSIALENMPLLADDKGPFGSPTSDSTRAMITEKTDRAMTVIFCFSGTEALQSALSLAAERFRRFAKATDLEVFTVSR